MADIQNILTKTESSKIGMVIKVLEKINFLREQCKVDNPYFQAFMEIWIKDGKMEAEYAIDCYEHVAIHRKNREGGGVIIYIREDITYNLLISVRD